MDWVLTGFVAFVVVLAAALTYVFRQASALDARTARLVVAAREVAFGGYFDGGCEHQQALIRELDQASEAFAASVPWDEQP